MSANAVSKPLHTQIVEHRKMWQELWWNMAKGDVTAYREIKKMDVFEFWAFFDKWREQNDREREAASKQNNESKQRK